MNEIIKGTPKRGVSVYSYSQLLGVSMTLEDCFKDIYDTGATCFELLTSHVENYPNPSPAWVDKYWRLCEKYKLQPGEMGHWSETHLHRGARMSDDEVLDELIRDFKLANLLGFTTMRTKITTINELCDPEPGWEKYMERALPYAEKYDVRMCSEVHSPTTLTRQHVFDYLEFIQKTGTKHFGFNVDFSTFQNKTIANAAVRPRSQEFQEFLKNPSKPADVLAVLPYAYACHAKFNYVDENFEEQSIPYKEVLETMVSNGWSGFLLSEYEGPQRDNFYYLSDQLRRQHIMISRILGY